MLPWRTGGAYRERLSSFRTQRCDVCCTDASCPFLPETGSCLSAGNGLIQQRGEFTIGAYWCSLHLSREWACACGGGVGMCCGVRGRVAVCAFVCVCVRLPACLCRNASFDNVRWTRYCTSLLTSQFGFLNRQITQYSKLSSSEAASP